MERFCRSFCLFVLTIIGFAMICGALPAFIVGKLAHQIGGWEIDRQLTSIVCLIGFGLFLFSDLMEKSLRNISPNKAMGMFDPLWVTKMPTGQTELIWYPPGIHFGKFWEEQKAEMDLGEVIITFPEIDIELRDGVVKMRETTLRYRQSTKNSALNRFWCLGSDDSKRKESANSLLKNWTKQLIQKAFEGGTALDVVSHKLQITSKDITEQMQEDGGVDESIGVDIVALSIADFDLPEQIRNVITAMAELKTIENITAELKIKFPHMTEAERLSWASIFTEQARLVLGGRGGRGPIVEFDAHDHH